MGKSTRTRSHARARQSARTSALEVFIRPQQTLIGRIAGLLVRLRVELTVLFIALLGYLWLITLIPPLAVGIVAAVVVLLIAAIPATRRFVTRRSWCVLTRHRVRTCFEQTRTMTHNGKMPYLVWARPTAVGERVRVWLPAGLAVKDIEAVSDHLATACWASQARIERDRRFASAVHILIVRRDPLHGAEFAPDLLDQVAPAIDNGTVVPLPRRDEVATGHSRQADEPAEHTPADRGERGQGRKFGKKGSPAAADDDTSEPAVRGFGGMDVSDYV